MNMKGLLDSLLTAGQQMAEQGKGFAENSLNIPKEESQRNAMLNGMGKGALATGALALLLGTKSGRSIGSKALGVGSIAALGGLAFKAYQNWQAQNQQTPDEQTNDELKRSLTFENLNDSQADARSKKLLQAMIAAAKADGHINEQEQQAIDEFMDSLGESPQLKQFVHSELSKPIDPAEIAKDTEAEGLAAQVYLMSRIIINDENFMEKAYLEELAKHLQLDPQLIAQLDKQAIDQQ